MPQTDATMQIRMCRTCPRYEPPPAPGTPRRGEMLQHAFRALLANSDYNVRVEVRVVTCLSGCSIPCNVLLEAPGKIRLRFSRLRPDDAPGLLAAVAGYLASSDGDPENLDLAPDFALRLSAAWPPLQPPSSTKS